MHFLKWAGIMAGMLLLIGLPGRAQQEPVLIDIGDIQRRGQLPRGIKQEPPTYPHNMAMAGLVGEVTLEFIINSQGRVIEPMVVKSNNPAFERAALDAVVKWKFKPAELDGRAVATRVLQRIEFALDDRAPPVWSIGKIKNHHQLPPEFQWDKAPVVKYSVFPVYPFEALQKKIRGRTKLSFVVGPDGRVYRLVLEEASTPEFGQAALAMIDAWRFDPALKKDGSAAYAIVIMAHDFNPSADGDVPVAHEAKSILWKMSRNDITVYGLKDLDHPPKPLSRIAPVYPSALDATRQPGEAVIEFYIDQWGDAQLPRIVSSSAGPFGYAAAQAVAAWRFEPPVRDGKPVVVRTQISIDFSPAQTPAGKK